MSKKIDHSSRAHAVLSASSSARWLKCPPSAVAATMYPNTATEYTREGTLAHQVAEAVADWDDLAIDIAATYGTLESYMDFKIREEDREEVTQEMIECAKAYADYIDELITDENAVVLLEQRLDLTPWVPEGFGTGDCIIIQGNRLDVVDYKYGKGVAVSAVDNSQMRLYALGALNEFGEIYEIHEVGMHIFQPRINNISVDVLKIDDLIFWGEGVKPIAKLAAEGKGDACSGEHCRFCPHAGSCPTLAGDCMKVVNITGGKAAVPTLAPWMIADILKQESVISAWLKAVKDRALTQLLNGEEIPGFKVVEGRGSRDWLEESQVIDRLAVDGGYSKEQIMTQPELLSPAALEKSIGKKKVAELVGTLIVSKPGNPTIAPESDKRKPFDRLAEAKKDFE
jgi:hypothetical protein